jgi:hypothetical protein
MRAKLLGVLIFLMASCFIFSCSTEKSVKKRASGPTREEIIHRRILECHDDIKKLTAEYYLLIAKIRGLQESRSSEVMFKELSVYLKKEVFGYAKEMMALILAKRLESNFSTLSINVMRLHGIYHFMLEFSIHLTVTYAKIQELSERREEGQALMKHYDLLVREAFPILAFLEAIYKAQDADLSEAKEDINRLNKRLTEMNEILKIWEHKADEINRDIRGK